MPWPVRAVSQISACLIVRDEAKMLPDCLASIAPFVDEICVVDTGSRDDTVAIAIAAGARIRQIVWQNDFAQARNVSLEMASKPWILVLDADERLVAETGSALRRVTEDGTKNAFFVVREDQKSSGPAERLLVARLFRNDSRIRYARPVHEDIMDAVCAFDPTPPEVCEVRLTHLGYLPEVMAEKDKLRRNVTILRQRVLGAPDDLYSAYKLLVSLGPSDEDESRRLVRGVLPQLRTLHAGDGEEQPYLGALFQWVVRALVVSGALEDARHVARHGMSVCPDVPSVVHCYADTLRRLGMFGEARALLDRRPEQRAGSLVRNEAMASVVDSWKAKRMALALDAREDTLVELGPGESAPSVQAAQLRWRIRRAVDSITLKQVDDLMTCAFYDDEVKLLAAELALCQGDAETARLVLAETSNTSDAGNLGHALLSSWGDARAKTWTVHDVPTAALANLVLGIVPPESMSRHALAQWTQHWSSERSFGSMSAR